jgi:DNA gyrase/topoisomerase IV subunit B
MGVTMPNPRFESQTKRKLVRDANLEKAIEDFMEKSIDKFMRKNKEYLDLVLERAQNRQRFQDLKDASKMGRKQKRQRVEKLLDANERRDRSQCTLFICEGDSAIGGLRSSRDKLLQGGIALKGKPMNVSQASIKDVLENQEFADIMASIGLTLGQPVVWEDMRYSRIVFLADSDVDGGHINTLLTNFFYSYWPELFEKNVIQMAKAPLLEVVTDQGIMFMESNSEFEQFKKKDPKIKEIHRNKGLGEMSPQAWKHIMSRKDYTKITAQDAKAAKDVLHICFGTDTNLRKELLMDSAKTSDQSKQDFAADSKRKNKKVKK